MDIGSTGAWRWSAAAPGLPAICEAFRDSGARVHVVDRDPRVEDVARELGSPRMSPT